MISQKRFVGKAKGLLGLTYGDSSDEDRSEEDQEDFEQENVSLISGRKKKRMLKAMSSSAAARRKLYSSNDEVTDAFGGDLYPERLYYPVHVGHSSENHYRFAFPKNETRTTKYNVFTFIPRFLFEQYKKATNVCNLVTLPTCIFGLLCVSCVFACFVCVR